MSHAPHLLNDDGTASMATALLSSHHGLRRDLARLTLALRALADGDTTKSDTVREEWRRYHATLHGHHQAEDAGFFPNLAATQPSLRAVLDRLGDDHRRIDPLLDAGDRVLAALPATAREALATVTELATWLDGHLALEEAEVIPFLRGAKEFPPPPDEAAAAMYADGFAWSTYGLAPDVIAAIDAMLPEILRSRLPAARAAFAARYDRIWGPTPTGASRRAIPDWLPGGAA